MSLVMLNMLGFVSRADMVGPASASLALAFGAGVLSTLNPCGFALLPAYVSYTVKQRTDTATDGPTDGPQTSWHRILRGGLLGLPLAAGCLLIFLVAGGVLALGGRLLVHLFPWLAIIVGTGLVLLGGWTLLTGGALEMPWLGAVMTKLSPSRNVGQEPAQQHTLRAAWLFGVGYGLSSLGCTLPVFLLVVGTAITTSGVSGAALVLASYAAGMALVLLIVSVAAATVGDLLRSTIFPLLRWVQPVAALFLIAAGGYIVFYQVHAGLW